MCDRALIRESFFFEMYTNEPVSEFDTYFL